MTDILQSAFGIEEDKTTVEVVGTEIPLINIETEKGPEVPEGYVEAEEKPLSKLKLQRMKEKQKKETRKLQRRVAAMTERVEVVNEGHKKKFNHNQAKWEQAKERGMDVWNNISNYENIAATAIMVVNRPDIIIGAEAKQIMDDKIKVFLNDIESIKVKWQETAEKITGKTGKVLTDEYPIFFLAYEEYITLGLDMGTVLADNAALLSEMIDEIANQVKAHTDKLKAEAPVETVSISEETTNE